MIDTRHVRKGTKAQRQAFAKAMQSTRLCGKPVFTKEELLLLSTYPPLSASQREQYAKLAAAME